MYLVLVPGTVRTWYTILPNLKSEPQVISFLPVVATLVPGTGSFCWNLFNHRRFEYQVPRTGTGTSSLAGTTSS